MYSCIFFPKAVARSLKLEVADVRNKKNIISGSYSFIKLFISVVAPFSFILAAILKRLIEEVLACYTICFKL